MRVFWVLSAARVLVGLLDLVGVLFLSQFSASAMNLEGSSTSAIPFVGEWTRSPLLALTLALIALSSKSTGSYFLQKHLTRILNSRCSEVIEEEALRLASSNKDQLESQSSQKLHYHLTAGLRAATTGILNPLSTIAAEGSLLVLFGGFLLLTSPIAALFCIGVLGLTSKLLHGYTGSRTYRLGQLSGAAGIESVRVLQETLNGFRELLVVGRLRDRLEVFSAIEAQVSETQTRQLAIGVLPRHVLETVVMLSLGFIAFSSTIYTDSASSVLLITIFGAATARVLPSLIPLQSSLSEIQNNLGKSAEGIEPNLFRTSLSTSECAVDADLEKPSVSSPGPSLEFQDVTFSYAGARIPALKSVSFEFSGPGWFAIDGPSGSGKSTCLDLLMGIRKPGSGKVTINNRTPRDFIEEHPGYCAYLPQRVELIGRTLAENVAIGVPVDEIDVKRVELLLEVVGLSNIAHRDESGIFGYIGDQEAGLSGGQFQRLGIARCLYPEPSILLLDESTSGLDRRVQEDILNLIYDLSRTMLLISVSHDVQVTGRASKVVRFDQGRVVGVD